jgi:GT2 family glycosyltransferase
VSTSLSVSIVTFAPDYDAVGETLRSLAAALRHAHQQGVLAAWEVTVVDNGPGTAHADRLRMLEPSLTYQLRTGQGNVGYGRGHNLALLASTADFHLVLNPDVVLSSDAIAQALTFMRVSSDVTMLAPFAASPAGERLYLCKRYPSVLDLLLRGFAPAFMRRWFQARLARYEMRELPPDRPTKGIPILSGSFMFCRRADVVAVGGFSDAFFLYFEDFDLSLRTARRGELAWVPEVRIVHCGGNAARKGLRHVLLFVRSAVAFFNRHGWKWA